MLKRFYGSAGSFAVAFDAPPGSRLMTAGDATVTAVTDAAISNGAAVSGPGRAVVRHGAGAVALWLEAPGVSAWPEPAAQTVSLPASMALSDPAATLRFDAATPMLLHVSTTGPVFAGLQQAGRTDAPALFAAGAELHRAVAAGPVRLRLASADDGPMGGTVSVWAEKLVPIGEGLGDSVAVAPGGTAAFSFTLPRAGTIGVGLRAEPDRRRRGCSMRTVPSLVKASHSCYISPPAITCWRRACRHLPPPPCSGPPSSASPRAATDRRRTWCRATSNWSA